MAMWILALYASVALVIALGDESAGDETCALQLRENRTKTHGPGQCTMCNTCGGDWPADAGRATYFQQRTTKWESYGEECSGQLRERTGDDSVIFSPHICCKSSGASLIQSEEGKVTTSSGPQGSCAICESCDGHTYSDDAGVISYVSTTAFNQNYEAFEGTCSSYYGSQNVNPSGSPPSGKLCCKPSPSHAPVGTCSLCGGSCGGSYTFDGGYLPYALRQDGSFETVKFTGWAEGCSNSYQSWSANSKSFLPKMCCNV